MLSGCTYQEIIKENNKSNIDEIITASESEVKDIALDYFLTRSVPKNARVKDYIPKEVKSLYEIKDEEDDIYIYIVNMKNKINANPNGDGYVIVAGDKRLIPVLAYSEKGQLEPKDLNPGQKIWLDYVRSTYKNMKYTEKQSSIAKMLWDRKSSFRLNDCPMDPWGNPMCDDCPPEYNRKYGPYYDLMDTIRSL